MNAHESMRTGLSWHRPVLIKTASIIVALLAVVAPRELRGQSVFETITLYSDASGGSCTLLDKSEGPLIVYVVNNIPAGFGLVSSRFRVASSAGFNADFVNEEIHMPLYIGDLRTGIDLAYAYCYTGSVLLATMTYAGHGISGACSYLEVLPHPESYSGGIDVMDCYFTTFAGSTLGPLIVNPGSSCPPWCTVPVKPTTWGAVKALYR